MPKNAQYKATSTMTRHEKCDQHEDGSFEIVEVEDKSQQISVLRNMKS